ncbi:MAG: NADPH:quinone reductase [Solirubrobacteraceae bacterium]
MDERMLAAQYETAGPRLGVLELVELERPRPAAGEVLVRLAVSAVNPTDVGARAGRAFHVAGERVVPGHDGAGEVVAVGDGVPAERVGERVWCYLAQWRRVQGTSASWIALPSSQAVALPDGVSLELGAGLGIPALTAHRSLFADGTIDGARILVQGGAGAVGHAAIELARFGGARVAATVSSPEKGELARAAGAELVVDYTSEPVVERVRDWAPDGVDRVVEVAVGTNAETDASVLAPFRDIVSYGAPDKPIAVPRALMVGNNGVRFVLVYTMGDAAQAQAVEDITRALRAGAMTALPSVRFPLEQIDAAHDAVSAHALGRVLIDVS